MPSHHYLSCLGQPVLLGPDGEPIRFRTRKHFGLLIYLAVEPSQSHRRQRLAELLWPRSGEAEARHSVATAISMFRNRLGPRSIQADRDNVRLTLDGLVLDLARLSRGEVLGDEVTPPLEIGNFLDDFELDDAPEFMLWRNRQQTRLFPAIREGLMLLIDRCRRTGNFRQIEVLADRLLAIDHLSEDGVRAKMEARAFDGDRLSALRIFEDWRGILSEELGAQPSTRIEGIALRLRRRGWERSESIEIPTVPTDHWRGHRFIGRGREYRAVYECWEQSARRSSHNVLLLGDSGVGKTTISDRLITAAGLEGAVTVRIQCYELDREIPYGALAGLVRGLLSRPGSTGTRPAALADLSVCIPEIRQRYPDLPQPAFADGEGVRIQLAEGTHELLSAVAEESPVILVVDDLHLADDASIAVLHLVLRRIADQPIMLMLTARPSELERSPSARRIREGSEALRLRTVDVPPMSEEESRELLAALLEGAGTEPTAAERRAFLAAAAGYPMVLELFVRDWLANGHRAMPLTLGAMTADLSQAEAAEHTYKALIDRMIHELPAEVRSVLNLAAVLGNRLNDLEMYGLVDLTLAGTMTGMTALNDLRLLRDNGHDLGFRNELIRAQAYMNVPSTLRRALHARVAQRLIDGLSEQPPTGLELAWHCFRAGRADEGQKYLLTGAREAIDEGAVCEAELALVSGMEGLPQSRRTEAHLLLAESLQNQSRWLDSLSAITKSTPGSPNELTLIAEMLQCLANWKLGRLDPLEASENAAEFLKSATETQSTYLHNSALTCSTHILADTNDRACSIRALNYLKAIRCDHDSSKMRAVRAFAFAVMSHFAESRSDFDTAEAAIEDAIAALPANTHGRTVHGLLMAHGSFKSSKGQYNEAIPLYLRALSVAEKRGSPSSIARSISNLMMCYVRVGSFADALALADRGRSTAASTHELVEFKILFYAAWSHAMLGEEQRALQLIQPCIECGLAALTPWIAQASHLLASDVYFVLQKPREGLMHARLATAGSWSQPLSRACVGPFVRSVANVSSTDRTEEAGLKRIEEVAEEFDCDLMDCAEIACAKLQLMSRLGKDITMELDTFQVLLKELPPAIAGALRSLGASRLLENPSRPPQNQVLL